MTDPEIHSYSRRLYHEEVEEFGIKYVSDEYGFDFGMFFTKGQSNEVLEVPESLGRLATKYNLFTKRGSELDPIFRDVVLGSEPCDKLKEGATEYQTPA